jgi:hypothetical protein
MRRLGKLLLATFGVAMAATSSALASGPAQAGYGGNGGNVQGVLAPGHSQGQLPFTGFNLAAIAVAAVMLLAVGYVLRRRTRLHRG